MTLLPAPDARLCPACRQPLTAVRALGGVCWSCGSCHGVLIGLGLLRQGVDQAALRSLWMRVDRRRGTRPCPACLGTMTVVVTPDGTELDLCRPCMLVWFDAGEMERLHRPSAAPKPARRAPVHVEVDDNPAPPPGDPILEGFSEAFAPLIRMICGLPW